MASAAGPGNGRCWMAAGRVSSSGDDQPCPCKPCARRLALSPVLARVAKGWTGRLWPVKQGIEVAESDRAAKYLMMTDAEIVHTPNTLGWLVAKADAEQLVLASVTARWRCENLAERVHIPAFIYYF